jgi:hypothetical protein
MTGLPDNMVAWIMPFENLIDSFGVSANRAINNAIHAPHDYRVPDDFPPELYALALALGAVAAGSQKAAEFATVLKSYGFPDEAAIWAMVVGTALEHFERKKSEAAATSGVH